MGEIIKKWRLYVVQLLVLKKLIIQLLLAFKTIFKEVNGYKDQFWNGITTHALSKICIGIINAKLFEMVSFISFQKIKLQI